MCDYFCESFKLNFTMKTLIVISLISFINLVSFCVSDRHIYGNLREGFDHKLHETVLIDYKGSEPKSYIIIFKYYAAYLLRIGYIEFNITANSHNSHNSHTYHEIQKKIVSQSPSTGNITTFDGKQFHPILTNYNLPTKNFYAKIDINDTLDVKATLRIYKNGIKSNIEPLYDFESHKSITIVYAKNDSTSLNKDSIPAQNAIGRRQKGDGLIHFQSRNVTTMSRFPSKVFEYGGSDYITYVKFRFNSPTAMVLINTTFIGEKEFNAVVYDMNTEHFQANISVYGMKDKPENRLGVISLM